VAVEAGRHSEEVCCGIDSPGTRRQIASRPPTTTCRPRGGRTRSSNRCSCATSSRARSYLAGSAADRELRPSTARTRRSPPNDPAAHEHTRESGRGRQSHSTEPSATSVVDLAVGQECVIRDQRKRGHRDPFVARWGRRRSRHASCQCCSTHVPRARRNIHLQPLPRDRYEQGTRHGERSTRPSSCPTPFAAARVVTRTMLHSASAATAAPS
jgi:hypothetical protein